MVLPITMPQLGESVTEGTIGVWLVNEGDTINQYAPICEIITDKVNAEIPSSYSGMIHTIIAQAGETVAVGETICTIEAQQLDESTLSGSQSAAEIATVSSDSQQTKPNSPSIKTRYSPSVMKLSREYPLNLTDIRGTGRGSRVTRQDVLDYIAKHKLSKYSSPEGQEVWIENEDDPYDVLIRTPTEQPGDTVIPVSAVRRAIAHKLSKSKQEIPHAWMMIEVDVTDLVTYRKQVKDEFKAREGINLTYLPFFISAVVDALREFPMVNSQWVKDKIILKKEINISLSVGTEDALYVPVIHGADERSILGLARAVHHLAVKTRQGKLGQEDVQGGTFTVNNTGSYGSIQSQPILNYPQAAILSIESIVKRPVIKDNMIAIRDIVHLCLSLDHRILDGVICGRFLQSIKKRLEHMGEGMDID